jgi:hypothetical protein
MSSIRHLSKQVLEDLERLCPEMKKSPREKLSLLVGVAIESGSCNLAAWAGKLPLETTGEASRYTWIERFFRAETLDDQSVMRALAGQVLAAAAQKNQTIVLCMDQTSIGNTHGILMVSCRVQNRGVPLFWTTVETAGNIGFAEQEVLLNALDGVLPPRANVLFLGDRFYGTAALVKACKHRGWGYRLRLKGNLTCQHQEGEITTGAIVHASGYGIEKAELYNTGVVTNIGVLHEKGHDEPWIIAMDALPSKTTVLDYGLRWGIESMFSDMKSRGFGLEDTHLLRSKRVTRLILVLAFAMHWAVIVGIPQQHPLKKTAL